MNRSEGLPERKTFMKTHNLKHSLKQLKTKLRLGNPMARVGCVSCYTYAEFNYYINKAMDKLLEEHACKRIQLN